MYEYELTAKQTIERAQAEVCRDYRIIYELFLPDRIVVLAVMHGRRDLTRKELQPWESD
jgi:plasmid stabilization system protein ParE